MFRMKCLVFPVAIFLTLTACSSGDDDWRNSVVYISQKYDEVDDSLSASTPEEAEEVIGELCAEISIENLADVEEPSMYKFLLVSAFSEMGIDDDDLPVMMASISDGMKELCPAELENLENLLGEPFAGLADK